MFGQLCEQVLVLKYVRVWMKGGEGVEEEGGELGRDTGSCSFLSGRKGIGDNLQSIQRFFTHTRWKGNLVKGTGRQRENFGAETSEPGRWEVVK